MRLAPRNHSVSDVDRRFLATRGVAIDTRELPGSAIPGSVYVREYCSSCEEAIRVVPAMVGKRSLCARCQRSAA